MKKTISIGDYYVLLKKYGDLNIKVNTQYGYKKILACDITAKNSPTIKIKTESGNELICSPDHKIKISNGRFIKSKFILPLETKVITNKGTSLVKSIEIDNLNKIDLYDIQVDEVEEYYSNGIISHNSSILSSLSYLLYNNTLETESQMKFGDLRYVNNRNGAIYCSAYGVIESGGQYYGLKRKTTLKKDKQGQINGAPTILNYYLLSSPDDDMIDNNSIEKLDEETRKKTQKVIDTIIGSYDNFMRVVMTTSDTLNNILSNNMADFIDSLLFDSGLDIFDKKLNALKDYKRKINEKPRISCNVDVENLQLERYKIELLNINDLIKNIEENNIPTTKKSIEKGKEYLEALTKKLYKIDNEIYNLNIEEVNNKIKRHNANIIELNSQKDRLEKGISELIEVYDEAKLNLLIEKKENYKTFEYNEKLKIKACEQRIRDEEHAIELINGKIFNLKKDGTKLKNEIENLKESKICPTCGQALDAEHQEHINETITTTTFNMFQIAKEINGIESNDLILHRNKIVKENTDILNITFEITKETELMIEVLKNIGELQNQKNDVEKRKSLIAELDQIPIKINNEKLNIEIFNQKLNTYTNSLLQIEDNKKIEIGITKSKARIKELEDELDGYNTEITLNKVKLVDYNNGIKNKLSTIKAFKEQEKHDELIKLYETCVHRNGIPKQMLTNYIIPKINETLGNILSVSPFTVWLDENDLKPKLVFNDRPNAIIDCISSSGKERTFSSIVIKFALNQINVKSKPAIFLLDEVMGKLDDNSVEEFKEILQLIKNNMKKVIIIEHKHEISPDYVINVLQDSDGISSLDIG